MKNQVSMQDSEELDIPDYIDKPEYVRNKTANYVLQTVGWFGLMWLFFPIVSAVLWLFEGHLIYDYVWVDQRAEIKTLYHLALLVALSASILLIWASYNWIRFRGEDRRSKASNSSAELLALQFAVESSALVELRQAQRITLFYDDQGHLRKYEINQ